MSMLKYWRGVLILALSLVIFAGYKMWPKPTPASTSTQTEVATKQIVKTVTTQPNGTIVEKTITTEKDTKVIAKSSDKSKYGVGAYINTADRNDYRVDVSARLGNLPLHGVVGYEVRNGTIYVGIRAEF